MKKKWINIVVILAITAVFLWFTLKDNFEPIMETLFSSNLGWLFLALAAFALYMVFDTLSTYGIIKIYKKDVTFRFALYLGVINKFFCGITPLASGGQPMQIYELKKKGVPVSTGANIEVQAYMMFQIALMFTAILSVIFNGIFDFFKYIPGLQQMMVVGFVINLVILLLLLFVSFSKNFNTVVARGIINALAKVGLVRNKKAKIEKWESACRNYYENGQELLRNKKTFAKGVCYQSLALCTYYLLPMLIALAIGCADNLNIINVFTASSYVFVMGCYVPIPGASGGMEAGFMGFFGNFVEGAPLSVFVLLWRGITYYMPMIAGAIAFNVHNGKGAVEKAEKLAKEAQEEQEAPKKKKH
jgi:uncharacterized protein (TIRG00374 family)